MHKTRFTQAGFTLIELMVTVAIFAILIAVAVPSYRETILAKRVYATANDFAAALSLARMEAIKRGRTVRICVSSTGVNCEDKPWTDGWLIGVAPGVDAVDSLTPTPVVRVFGAVSSDILLTAPVISVTAVDFNNLGMVANWGSNWAANGSSAVFTSKYSGCVGQVKQEIQLSLSGAVSVKKATCP